MMNVDGICSQCGALSTCNLIDVQTTIAEMDKNERNKLKDIVETEEEFQEIEIDQHFPLVAANVAGDELKQKKQLSMVIEEGNREEDNSERKEQEEGAEN